MDKLVNKITSTFFLFFKGLLFFGEQFAAMVLLVKEHKNCSTDQRCPAIASFHCDKNASAFMNPHSKNAPSNKTQVITESINMEIWEVGTMNQLFLRGYYIEIKFSKKKKKIKQLVGKLRSL